jgi:flagellar hook protein FlgE
MSPVSAIALSGMRAAQIQLGVAGHNIANLATDGFRRQRAELATVQAGGVTALPVRLAETGNAPETDLVAMLQAKNSFLANLSVFRTGDRMLGSLLDAVG